MPHRSHKNRLQPFLATRGLPTCVAHYEHTPPRPTSTGVSAFPDGAAPRAVGQDNRGQPLVRRPAQQQIRCDTAKATVSARGGFERLDADDAQDVLSPIEGTRATTTDAAVLRSLAALRDAFDAALTCALATANDRLDRLLNERLQPVVRVASQIANREVATEAELDALLAELRALIAPHVAAGRRVRLT